MSIGTSVTNSCRTDGCSVRIYTESSSGWEETNPTFAAAICASKPLAIDLGVKLDPPAFGAYHTEPGSCTRKLLAGLRYCGLATHVVRSSAVVVNPRGLGRQEPGILVDRCAADLVDVVLEMLCEDPLSSRAVV